MESTTSFPRASMMTLPALTSNARIFMPPSISQWAGRVFMFIVTRLRLLVTMRELNRLVVAQQERNGHRHDVKKLDKEPFSFHHCLPALAQKHGQHSRTNHIAFLLYAGSALALWGHRCRCRWRSGLSTYWRIDLAA